MTVKSKVIILIGKSGSGKSTVAKTITEQYGIDEVVSNTTRQPTGRIENYKFLTREDFNQDFRLGIVVEYAEFAGNLYWSTLYDFQGSQPLIMIAEPTGAQQLKDNLRNKEVIRVYLACDTAECIDRMQIRGDSGGAIAKRVLNDRKHFESFNCEKVIDVTHLKLNEVVDEIMKLV